MTEQPSGAVAISPRARAGMMVVVTLMLCATLIGVVAVVLMPAVIAHSLFGRDQAVAWLPHWTPIIVPLMVVLGVIAAGLQFTALRLWRARTHAPATQLHASGATIFTAITREVSTGLVAVVLVESLAVGAAIYSPLGLLGGAVASTPSAASRAVHGNVTLFPPIPGRVGGMTIGPDGNVWFLSDLEFGYVTPAGQLHTFSYPNFLRIRYDLIVGPDHNFWCVALQNGGDSTFANDYIGKFPPTGDLTEFALPPRGVSPSHIEVAAGSDGNVWYLRDIALPAENVVGVIGRVTPSGAVREYTLPTPNVAVGDLILGPDGNIWFDEDLVSGGKIGRITPTGTITEYSVPSASSGIVGLIVGSDGNLWFGEESVAKIGRVSLDGTIHEFSLPGPGYSPTGLAFDAHGNLWFTGLAGKIGRMTPAGVIAEFPLPSAKSVASAIIPGPDGNLWFIENVGGKIGRIAPSGAITEYPLRISGASVRYLLVGPDHNMWFAETVSRSGTQTSYIGYVTP